MSDAFAAARAARIPVGATAIAVRLFASAGVEVESALRPPWPHWMRRRYELERLADAGVDTGAGEVPLHAAIATAADRVHHRLGIISWVAGALEQTGWELLLVDDHVVAHKVIDPGFARLRLERDGILGPLTNVSELGADGQPLLFTHAELHAGAESR